MPSGKCILIICLMLFSKTGLFAQDSNVGQNDLTGLWQGTLYNDSTQKTLRYEVAISNKKNKLTGYSVTFFLLDDKEYFGLKKVNIREKDGKIVIEDEGMVDHNYPEPPIKGIRQLNVLTLDTRGDSLYLSGTFSTNSTKKYSSVTGYINLQHKTDLSKSELLVKLKEQKLDDELSFIKKEVVPEPVAKTEKTAAKTEKPIVKVKDTIERPILTDPKKAKSKPPETVKLPAADLNNRTIETVQSVYFKSDSLMLTLYDNGEVDGDTVSVLMNGIVIMPKVGLSTRPVRKTIYITNDMPDSIQLVMYAENLGSIPPNTGLLVVHDGNDIYEIRFSGDLKKNAAIIFRRKQK